MSVTQRCVWAAGSCSIQMWALSRRAGAPSCCTAGGSGMNCSPYMARKQSLQSQRVRWQIPIPSACGTRARVPVQKSTRWFPSQWRLFSLPCPFLPPSIGAPSWPPSQHHLWLRVHLFWITVPPLDLWFTLTLESHFSRNDNEFEDKSWKNTLLLQLRFPCVA